MSPYRSTAPFTDEWPHFQFSVSEGVGTIAFDRPDKLNALTFDVYADLRDLLVEVEQRDDVSVLVITGTGKGFCSGGDVDEIIGALLDFTRMTGAVVENMRRLPMPILAAVNGVAAGAGAVIALAADLRLLASSASFHFLFTKVGLAGADMGSAYLLPRVVGLGRASEMLLLGERGVTRWTRAGDRRARRSRRRGCVRPRAGLCGSISRPLPAGGAGCRLARATGRRRPPESS